MDEHFEVLKTVVLDDEGLTMFEALTIQSIEEAGE